MPELFQTNQIPQTQKTQQTLENCTYKNTPSFTFKDKVFKAKCIKVYDGDTITAAINVFGGFYKFSIRMDGYDAPEIKPKKENPGREEEKKWAKKSKEYLSGLVLNKMVELHCKDYDKYGRILAEVTINEESINKLMLKNGYCRQYSGGKKEEWDFSKFE